MDNIYFTHIKALHPRVESSNHLNSGDVSFFEVNLIKDDFYSLGDKKILDYNIKSSPISKIIKLNLECPEKTCMNQHYCKVIIYESIISNIIDYLKEEYDVKDFNIERDIRIEKSETENVCDKNYYL